MMKVSSEMYLAPVRAAVAEQRSATLALDRERLTVANTRLEEALSVAKKRIQQRSEEQGVVSPDPLKEVKDIQRELSANANLVNLANASNQRAMASVAAVQSLSPVYGADGTTNSKARIRPIGEA